MSGLVYKAALVARRLIEYIPDLQPDTTRLMMAPLTMLSIAFAFGLLGLRVVASDTFMVNSNRTFVQGTPEHPSTPPQQRRTRTDRRLPLRR